MHCPKCGYDRAPEGAQFCPNCGQAMPPATSVQVQQQVRQLLGQMVGVAVQGNVYGGEFRTVQVYALTDAGRAESWDRFLTAKTPPYKFLAPYAAQDRALFFGRDDKTAEVVRRIGEGRLLVLYGPAGVGKTSLLAAGVIPQLMQAGALALCLNDYFQPIAKAIRTALADSAEPVPVRLPEEASLSALVRAVVASTRGSLVLVLDQFERVFEPRMDAGQREALITSVAQALQEVEPQYLRLILAVREDALPRLAEWQGHLPGVLGNTVALEPLTRLQAQAATEKPLVKLQSRVSFVGDLVPGQLLPDLDELTPKTPDAILPAQLQIVCSRLYEAACQREPPHIDSDLYVKKAKGANGIMATYAADMLRTQLADREALAKRVLGAMASSGMAEWVSPERLPLDSASSEDLQDVLKRLVNMQLLAARAVDGRYEYGFASPSVAEAVRRMADPDVKGHVQAEDELGRIWDRWLAYLDEPRYDALTSRGQLRYLAQAGGHLKPSGVQALLMLRSAVTRDEPAGPWLEWLGKDKNPALIAQLEEPDAANPANACTLSTLDKAERLLGLHDVAPPAGKPFGRVASCAVSHKDAVVRQTAALALTVLDPAAERGIGRLDAALREESRRWRRSQRRAELHGALADASPDWEQRMQKRDADLAFWDRAAVGWWRAWRRILRDRQRIGALTFGGAIGAGLGLALLRAVTAALTRKGPGIQFAMNSYLGGILGAALTLGMLLAEPLLLAPLATKEADGMPPPAAHTRALLAAALGALFFGLTHVLIASILGDWIVATAPILLAAMNAVSGVGLSLALYNQPRAGWRLGLGWIPRLGAAALNFLLTQGVFILFRDPGEAVSIVWPGRTYRADLLSRYGLERWSNHAALLDAALVGIVLAVGTTAGLLLAAQWLAKWRHVLDRAGD